MFEKKYIFRFNEDLSRDKILEIVGEKFLKDSVVKESFIKAIQTRENEFPTGMKLQGGTHIAISHTDDIHILNDKIAIVLSEKPILFKNIEDGVENISCHIFFIMALTKENKNNVLCAMAELLEEHEKILQNFSKMSDDEILEVLL